MRDEASFGDRIEFVAGSFFERCRAATSTSSGTILHDWPDEEAAAILRTIRAAAPDARAAALIDSVIPPGNERRGSSGSTC